MESHQDMTKAGRVCVLDLETRLSDDAVSLLGRSERPTIERSALQEIAAVSLLTFDQDPHGICSGFELISRGVALGDGEPAMIDMIESRLLPLWHGGGILVTHNGRAHDVPACRRRAAYHRLFAVDGIIAWQDAPRDRHVDTLERWSDGGGRKPSLVDLCAGFGIPGAMPPISPRVTVTLPPAIRKGQLDVVCTALVHMHGLSFRERTMAPLALGWQALARYLLTPAIRGPHLMAVVDIGLIDRRRGNRLIPRADRPKS